VHVLRKEPHDVLGKALFQNLDAKPVGLDSSEVVEKCPTVLPLPSGSASSCACAKS